MAVAAEMGITGVTRRDRSAMSMKRMIRLGRVVGLATVGIVMACASADDSPVAPSPRPPAAGGNPTQTIVVTPAGVSPSTVTIRLGERVLFSNNDTVDHEMASDQHPTHEGCPAINQVGFLRPGEARETGNFTTVETCMFHDHLDSTNSSLNGTIIVIVGPVL